MKTSALLAMATLLILGAQCARADLIENIPFSLTSSPISTVTGTVSVPQFDPAQGTLNSVTLSITPTVEFALEVFDDGAGPVSVTAADTFSFGGIPIPTEGIFSSTIPANQSPYTFMATASEGPLTEFFDSGTAAVFAGTVSVPFDISIAPPKLVQFSGPTTTSALAFSGVTGTVTADFAFTPAQAPEPATFAAAGLGLIAVGACTRRKRGNRAHGQL